MEQNHSTLPKFQQHAHSYDQFTPIQSLVSQHLSDNIQCYFKDLSTKFHVMDLGCGTGKLTLSFLQQIHLQQDTHIVCYGVDNATNMLSLWQKNCQQFLINHPLANIHFLPICQDFTQPIPIQPPIELCFSSFALHWGHPKNLLPILSMLAPQGQAHFAIPVFGSFDDVQQKFPCLPIYPFLSADLWRQALIHQGKLLYSYQQQFSFQHQNLRELLIHLRKMGGVLNQPSQMSLKILSEYLQSPKSVLLDYQVLFVGMTV